MAYKAQGNKPVIPRIFYYRHSWLAWFYRGFPIKDLWILNHFNSYKWDAEWKKAKQR
jgi:hypothetical protein